MPGVSQLFFHSILFFILFIITTPCLAQTRTQEVRRDNYFGTFHEGMRIESGAGQDTVITVTPPPDTQQQEGDAQQGYPIIVAPQVNTPPYGPRPTPRPQGQ